MSVKDTFDGIGLGTKIVVGLIAIGSFIGTTSIIVSRASDRAINANERLDKVEPLVRELVVNDALKTRDIQEIKESQRAIQGDIKSIKEQNDQKLDNIIEYIKENQND